ncbi:MAG: cation:H+ antiporter [Gammaproteobacteria bacterium]|jgi:cation:H+ antiporter
MIDSILLAVGLVGLYFGGDLLLRGALALGGRFSMPPVVIGLVIVGLGTSAPELAVSLDAALNGYGDMAVGNVVGSNIVNIALVLGLAASCRYLRAPRSLRQRDLPTLALLTALAVYVSHDQFVSRIEGLLLLAIMTVALLRVLRQEIKFTPVPLAGTSTDSSGQSLEASTMRSVGWLGLGVVLLLAGAEATVTGAVGLAKAFGVSEAIIALTVTSIGTGLPEIAATVVAIKRNQMGLALGNVVGSNMINIGLVLGLSAVVAPLSAGGITALPLFAMMALTVALVLLAWWREGLSRWTGIAFLSTFGIYNGLLFLS